MTPNQPDTPPDAEPGEVLIASFTDPLPDETASDGQLTAWMGTDAVKWARAFGRMMESLPDDQDPDQFGAALIGWFAAAIEAGRDAGRSDIAAAIDLVRTMDALGLKVTSDLGAAHKALVALTDGQKRVVIVHRTVDADKLAAEIVDRITVRQAQP